MREVKSGAVFARLSKCEEHLNEVLKFKYWGKKGKAQARSKFPANVGETAGQQRGFQKKQPTADLVSSSSLETFIDFNSNHHYATVFISG